MSTLESRRYFTPSAPAAQSRPALGARRSGHRSSRPVCGVSPALGARPEARGRCSDRATVARGRVVLQGVFHVGVRADGRQGDSQ